MHNISIEKIREFMDEQSDQDLSTVALQDNVPLKDYGLDSMGLISMAFDLDDALGIQLDDSALERMQTLGDIKKLLSEHDVTVS